MKMMNEILNSVWLFAGGILLGIVFFGGLWITVKNIVHAKSPALWLLGSFFVRTAIVLLGFYFIGAGNLQRLLICLAGFIAARFIVLNFTKEKASNKFQIKKEVTNET